MLNALKRKVRTWEAEGRHGGLTRLLTMIWVAGQNTSDLIYCGRLKDGLPTDDPDIAVGHVVRGSIGRPVRPMQIEQELAGLIRFVADRKPERLVEIGTARGGTLMLLCKFAAPDATIISVDLPYGRNGGGYPRWKERIYRSFAQPGQTLHLIRANSHSPETVASVQELLPDGQADFILIDADHSYDGVKSDFENYSRMAAPGGTVALHDIVENIEDPSIDVARFWRELESGSDRDVEMIVHDPEQSGYGLGLVHLPR